MPLRGRRVKKRPVILPVPTTWKLDEKEQKKAQEEQEQHDFMQECRERTVTMKDEAKCDHCKLRFRCYTEIKVKAKRKSRVRKPKPEPDDGLEFEDMAEEVKKLYVKNFGKRSTNLES